MKTNIYRTNISKEKRLCEKCGVTIEVSVYDALTENCDVVVGKETFFGICWKCNHGNFGVRPVKLSQYDKI
jgi:Zn finger protein HypA/HybF involved in hydrogenase expression